MLKKEKYNLFDKIIRSNQMIRQFQNNDLDEIINIWFTCSKESHSFIDSKVWEDQIENMRIKYIPNSETYVFEESNKVFGFISLVDEKLAALFVSPKNQKRGIGGKLINKVKELKSNLELKVYSQNNNAIKFYEKHGFKFMRTNICNLTKCEEYIMKWYK